MGCLELFIFENGQPMTTPPPKVYFWAFRLTVTYAIANTTDLLFCPPKKYGGQGRHIRTSCEASCQDLNISTQCNLIKLASFSIWCRWAKWYKSEAHAIACCIQPQWEITSSQKKKLQQQNWESRWQLAMSLFEETFSCADCDHFKQNLKMTVFSAIWECQTNLTSSFTQ